MGKVAVSFRIMPQGLEVDLAAVQARVREALGGKLKKLTVNPVAFGLKAVDVLVVVDDASGEMEGIETALGGIPGVGGVETTEISLL